MRIFEDRELLELAAKASGIEVVWLESSYYGPTMAKVEVRSGEGEITEPWNPLTDDGDALRLAVKLKIDIDNMTDACYCEGEYGHDVFVEIENDDPYAATRRAITIVAAKIARGSKCE